MPHVDEGTLHALLDGELPSEDAAQVRIHFATCPACAARLDEARHLLAETERLVSALELPEGSRRAERTQAATGAQAAAAATVSDVLLPPSPGTPLPPLDPVVLIPENPTPREVRRGRLRHMAWAAGFLVVVGAGYLGVKGVQVSQAPPREGLTLSPDEFTTVAGTPAQAPPDSAPTLALTDSDAPAARPPAPAKDEPKTAPVPADAKARAGDIEQAQRAQPAPAPTVGRAAQPAAPPPPAAPAEERREMAKTVDVTPRRDTAADLASPAAAVEESAAVNRQSAAEATAELDRRRTRERAAEATAALERELAERRAAEERQRQLAAQATAAPAAAPEAGNTGGATRIGLDEAARQLGGPLHAIDGMSRQSITLLPGTSIEGADPSRPVVRAVYADRSGTPLFLDQQMARPGAGPATPQAGRGGRQVWVKDGVLLILHGGNLSADSLRSLARRVR